MHLEHKLDYQRVDLVSFDFYIPFANVLGGTRNQDLFAQFRDFVVLTVVQRQHA